MSSRLLALILSVTATSMARGQTVLFEAFGTALIGEVGFSVAGGADYDQDGYDDVIVGAPFLDSGGLSQNGMVRVFSGRDGSVLLTKVGDNSFDFFGWSVAVADDIDGDGHPELVVGAPHALQLGLRPGMVRLVSGRTAVTLHTAYGLDDDGALGYAVTGRIDWDGDGVGDFVGGAPAGDSLVGFATDPGYSQMYSGATGAVLFTHSSVYDNARWGQALATGDVNDDGSNDLIVGIPEGGTSAEGMVVVIGGATHVNVWNQFGAASGDEFGSSLTVGDTNNDGFADVLVGAPDDDFAAANAGSVRALNGQTGSPFHTWYGTNADQRFGASIALIGDVDDDGRTDLAVGAPATFAGGVGVVHVISTGTQAELFRVEGEADDRFGHAVARAGDFNGDGSRDFVVGAPLAENPHTSTVAGLVRVFSGAGPGFVAYCTAGTSASGCQAQILTTGAPSATAQMGFFLGAVGVEGNKSGIFFYGANGRQANPWGNGTSFNCVAPPVKRGGLLAAAGTAGLCNGNFLQDLNARWCPSCPKPSHNPGAGAVVQAQLWYRDPQNTSNQTTSFSNAVEFAVSP